MNDTDVRQLRTKANAAVADLVAEVQMAIESAIAQIPAALKTLELAEAAGPGTQPPMKVVEDTTELIFELESYFQNAAKAIASARAELLSALLTIRDKDVHAEFESLATQISLLQGPVNKHLQKLKQIKSNTIPALALLKEHTE